MNHDDLPTLPRGISLHNTECGEGAGSDPVAYELVSWDCENGCRCRLVQVLCEDPDRVQYEIRHPVAVGRHYYEMLPTTCECGGVLRYEARALLPQFAETAISVGATDA